MPPHPDQAPYTSYHSSTSFYDRVVALVPYLLCLPSRLALASIQDFPSFLGHRPFLHSLWSQEWGSSVQRV